MGAAMWRPTPTSCRAFPVCLPPATCAAGRRWWCGPSPRGGRRRKESIGIWGGKTVGGAERELSELRSDGKLKHAPPKQSELRSDGQGRKTPPSVRPVFLIYSPRRGFHEVSRAERPSQQARRPILLGYRVERRNVADGHAFTARLYHAALFPSGEQPADGENSGAGH